tara:strand:+ start:168 stop:278 length:111 start_codon:yes stop_codon:yes gene_type:complete
MDHLELVVLMMLMMQKKQQHLMGQEHLERNYLQEKG